MNNQPQKHDIQRHRESRFTDNQSFQDKNRANSENRQQPQAQFSEEYPRIEDEMKLFQEKYDALLRDIHASKSVDQS